VNHTSEYGRRRIHRAEMTDPSDEIEALTAWVLCESGPWRRVLECGLESGEPGVVHNSID
jgi:hypothetical protein